MSRHNLNLFDFYRDVALQYREKYQGISGINDDRHNILKSELSDLQKAYFDCQPVQYNTPNRMIAYALHFAPKHAVIWRCIANRSKAGSKRTEMVLNSIGTGPGSEIFGFLCGLPGLENLKVRFVFLESEEAWRDLFEIARDEFATRTGILIDGFMTDDTRELEPEGITIGSFVLSDAARRSETGQLIAAIRDATTNKKASFLDFDTYTNSMGKSEFVNTPIKKAGFKVTFRSLNDDLNIAETIRNEMAYCNPIYCEQAVKDNLPLRQYTVQLR